MTKVFGLLFGLMFAGSALAQYPTQASQIVAMPSQPMVWSSGYFYPQYPTYQIPPLIYPQPYIQRSAYYNHSGYLVWSSVTNGPMTSYYDVYGRYLGTQWSVKYQ